MVTQPSNSVPPRDNHLTKLAHYYFKKTALFFRYNAQNPILEHLMTERKATVTRNTLESQITITVNLDGSGRANLETPVPFLNHMLDQVARHGLIDLDIQATGDTHIDDHHTVEDIGITLGMAVAEAIGDKKGLTRYGHAYVPLDESLSRVVLDFSGRPGLFMQSDFVRGHVGTFDVDLSREFFQGFVNHAFVTLHVDNIRGANAHHQVETIFKAFGRALRMATSQDERMAGLLPSTKGHL
jgi:imidazoleglycerol-phosphate dehydratase|tara:strand:+ start:909 stop:1631 length:723 start_codon:yes stop_codon:yes gene_type:complete